MRRALSRVVLLAACAALVVPILAAAADDPARLLSCARAEWQRNQAAYRDYECKIISYRTAWQLDGTLDRDNVLNKIMYFKQPDKRQEVFVSGTSNGKPAERNDFIFERLGLDNQTTANDIEVLRPGSERLFKFRALGAEQIDGKPFVVLGFESLKPDQTELQHGKLFLEPERCMLRRIQGRVVNRMIQRNELDFRTDFAWVRQDVWLPVEIEVQGVMSMGLMKRRTLARNVLSNYRLDQGLSDELFK